MFSVVSFTFHQAWKRTSEPDAFQCARPGARMNGAPSPKSAAFLAHLRIIRGDHRVFEPRKLINYLCNLQLILIGGHTDLARHSCSVYPHL